MFKNLSWVVLLPVLYALLIIFVGFFVVKGIMKVLDKVLNKSQKINKLVVGFVEKVVKILLWIVILLAALEQVGVNPSSFLTLLAAAGAAIALALKDSLSNLAGGILLMVSAPFEQGDFIEGCGTAGTVQKIDLLQTTVITPDSKTALIPNGALMNSTITNYSKSGLRRVDMQIGVAYGSDINLVKKTLIALAENNAKVLTAPAPECMVGEFAGSSVTMYFRVYCSAADYWDVYFGLQDKMKDALKEAGVSIPYPQLDVHIDK